MRFRLVRFLHNRGVHAFCHRRFEAFEFLASIRLDDGTLWKPDINGMPSMREVHF